jgi:hypothetical protein
METVETYVDVYMTQPPRLRANPSDAPAIPSSARLTRTAEAHGPGCALLEPCAALACLRRLVPCMPAAQDLAVDDWVRLSWALNEREAEAAGLRLRR